MKISKLRIKNFRAIGAGLENRGIEIDLDSHNLIFLIGKNNTGKSSILKAYEFFVKSSQAAQENDFYNKSTDNQIEIEMWICAENADDENHRAISNFLNSDNIVKIKKVWTEIGKSGKKYSFHPADEKWVSGGAGGFDTLLQNACPDPVWVEGLTSPEDVISILKTLVKETILKSAAESDAYSAAITAIQKLQGEIERSEYAGQIATRLNGAIASVFPNINCAISNRGELDFSKLLSPQTDIEVQETDKPGLTLDCQGHGVRRQFILSAMSGLAGQLMETQKRSNQRKEENYVITDDNGEVSKTRYLLFEEPELFLHPDAMRSVKDLIYELADNSEFQILAATHSPIMVDLSKPHVTLVRVTNDGENGTLLHQVSHDLFDNDERHEMQMLNRFNPYTCEAFFADRVILVEGDTETVALRTLMNRLKDEENLTADDHLCVLNCGTKMSIPLFQKVLRHFGIPYFVLHDIDYRTSANGNSNPAWTLNERIWEEIESANAEGIPSRRFLFDREFESAHHYEHDASQGKPFSAYQQVNGWDLQRDTLPLIKYLKCVLGLIEIDETFSQSYIDNLEAETESIDAQGQVG